MLALIYELVDDYVERRAPLRAEHLRLAREAHARGEIVFGGAFTDPADRALFAWAGDDRSLVERFVAQDPYVREGLVTGWEIRSWNVAVGGR